MMKKNIGRLTIVIIVYMLNMSTMRSEVKMTSEASIDAVIKCLTEEEEDAK